MKQVWRDDAKLFGEIRRPFALRTGSVGAFIMDAIALLIVTTMLALFPNGLLLMIWLATGDQPLGWYFAIPMIGIWLLVAYGWWSFRTESFYDKQQQIFVRRRFHGFKKGATKEKAWPVSVFAGVSWGRRAAESAWTKSVRLETKQSGVMVDGFFTPESMADAKRKAELLASYSGLPLLEERTTGRQHALDDLWLRGY